MDTNEQKLLARCAAIGVSSWSDALDELAINGVLQGITQRSGSGRMCGFAVTARQLSGRLGDFEKSDFAVGPLVAATGPGKVLMVDVGGAPISTLGGLASLAASKQGASGVVIDGACRDIDEIRVTKLWLASRWVVPTTGKRRLKLQPLGGTVSVGGIQVSQGDLVAGDGTGIVVVPRERLLEVLEQAERIVAIDERVEERIRAGESFGSAAAAAGISRHSRDGRHDRRTAALPKWVKNGSVGASTSFPLYPTKQTSTVATATSVSCRLCCKSPKMPCDQFFAKRQNKRQPSIDVASGPPANSPVS